MKKKLGTCKDCGEAPAVLAYCDSVLEYTHGMAIPICLKCYEDRLKRAREKVDEILREIAKGEFIP